MTKKLFSRPDGELGFNPSESSVSAVTLFSCGRIGIALPRKLSLMTQKES